MRLLDEAGLPEGVGAVGAQRHPELERVEATRGLEREVREIVVGGVFGVEVVRVPRHEGAVSGIAQENRAAGHRLEVALVEVDGDAIGCVDAAQTVSLRGREQQDTPVRGVDMQVHPSVEADLGDGL